MQTPFKKMEKVKVRKSAGSSLKEGEKSSGGKRSSSPATGATSPPKSPVKSGSGSSKVKTKVKVKVKANKTNSSKF